MRMLLESVEQLEELQRQEHKLIEEEKRFQLEQMRREEMRREEEQREKLRLDQLSKAGPAPDRKERELAFKIQSLEAEERKADERQDEPPGEPAPGAAGSEAMTLSPPNGPLPNDSHALPAQESVQAGPFDPVPLPKAKPQRRPTAASYGAVVSPLRAPAKRNVARTPQPVTPDPEVVEQNFGSSEIEAEHSR